MERFDTIVIGGSQAGLATGYHLKRHGRSFVILDALERVGDAWRTRWDSLRLFTPSRHSALPGLPFPKTDGACPTKDEMADYLEAYARRFDLPVRTGVRVSRLGEDEAGFVVETDTGVLGAENVVIATGANRDPRVPALASNLDPAIVQLHSSAYRNPSQLAEGGVLVVGAGNSGADISLELARSHVTWLSGPDTGYVPVDVESWFARNVVFPVIRFAGLHVLTVRTPMGRRAREKELRHGTMLVRIKPKQLIAAGIERVPRVTGVQGGTPVLEDGRVLGVANVIWCTGFRQDLSWVDLPIFGEDGEVLHDRGFASTVPGLAFVGLRFQFSAGSEVLPGVAGDARYVVRRLPGRDRRGATVGEASASTA
jgi:putative flavoprotein involved in K+ transport